MHTYPYFSTMRLMAMCRYMTVCLTLYTLFQPGCQLRQPLRFTVLFYNAPRLEISDPVFYQSARVGEVISVSSPAAEMPRYKVVVVELDPEYRHVLHRQMAFTVDSFRLLNRQRRIVIMDRVASTKIPVRNGDVFVGTTYLRYLMGQTSDIAIDMMEVLKTFSETSDTSINRLLPGGSSPELNNAERLKNLFKQYLDQLRDMPGDTHSDLPDSGRASSN